MATSFMVAVGVLCGANKVCLEQRFYCIDSPVLSTGLRPDGGCRQRTGLSRAEGTHIG